MKTLGIVYVILFICSTKRKLQHHLLHLVIQSNFKEELNMNLEKKNYGPV